MKSYEIKFLISVRKKAYRKKKINYCFPIIHYWGFYFGYKISNQCEVSFDPEDDNKPDRISIIAWMIVRDWITFEVLKRDDFVHGLANLREDIVLESKELKQSFIDIVNQILIDKFNQEYADNYTGEEGQYLFTVDFAFNEDKCELLATENKFLSKQEYEAI